LLSFLVAGAKFVSSFFLSFGDDGVKDFTDNLKAWFQERNTHMGNFVGKR